ncbi:MAG: hypothetical protein Q8L52_00110 [bacterium]|nr:hypothetical protein [bacterium]
MKKSAQIIVYGPQGLLAKASGMFEFTGKSDIRSGINFLGVCFGNLCLASPKHEEVDQLCRIRICCSETGDMLEVCGYASGSFVAKALHWDEKSRLTIGGGRMLSRLKEKKSVQHEYVLDFEVIREMQIH